MIQHHLYIPIVLRVVGECKEKPTSYNLCLGGGAMCRYFQNLFLQICLFNLNWFLGGGGWSGFYAICMKSRTQTIEGRGGDRIS